MSEVLLSLGRLLLLFAAAYAVVAVAAHFLSLGMLFPRPSPKYELTSDYIQLTAPDGVKLVARHWPNPAAKYTLLYLHGNYETLGSMAGYIPQFLAAGYAVFAVDYRRYGQSEGVPTEGSTCADAALAYDYMRTKLGIPADQIVIFGYSLGAGPGIELALHKPVAGLMVQGAFVSAYRVLTRYPLLPGDKFRNLAKMPQLKVPVLVIHGMADDTVPFWHAQMLYDAVQAPKAKLFIERGPHAGLADFTGPRYWAELRKFTDSL